MEQAYRIIIAGTRDFNDYDMLYQELSAFVNIIADNVSNQNQIEFVSGTARGADTLGEKFADETGYPVKRFHAKWNKYGKAAGPIRNEQMAEYASEKNGVLFVFWDGKSRGTKSMIKIAEMYGLEIHIIKY